MPTHHLSQLDDATVQYLELAIRSDPGRLARPGVLVTGASGAFASPRDGWGCCVVLGMALLGAAGLLALPRDTPRDGLVVKAAFCGAALGLAYVLLQAGLARVGRPARDPRLGNFLFADSVRIWELVDGYVTTLDYADDLSAVGHRHYSNGFYTHTSVTARASSFGSRSWVIPDGEQAQRLLGFLQVIGHLRRSDDETYRTLAASGSGHLGRAAVLILDDVDPEVARGLPAVVDPPPAPAGAGTGPVGWGTVVARFLVGGAIGAAAFVGSWKGNEYLREEKLFAATKAEPRGSFGAVDQYLAEYPDGRYAGEVRDLRDDRMFDLIPTPVEGDPEEVRRADRYLSEYPAGRHSAEARDLRDDSLFAAARRESDASSSPGGLRKYLAERQNTRHRQEATRAIGGYYEKTAAELRARAKKDKGKLDPELINALVALVEALKGVDDPVLTVGFIPQIEPEPKAAAAKKGEEETYKYHLTEGRFKDNLKALEKKNPGNSALVPHQGTFGDEYVRTREEMIFTRLSDAIRKGIRADILTLRKAAPGEQPNIEVRYRIFPAGFVLPFNEVDDDNKPKRTIGLVREYFIDWALTFRPPGGGKEAEYRTETRPGPNLLYRMEKGDPDWAIYAVSLYSAFYDLSDKMIRAFGQDPGRAPDAFTFRGIGSNRTDRPPAADAPDVPKLPRPKFTP